MDKAGADWTFVNFSGAVHCFALKAANSPPGCVYSPRAAKRAYRMMEDFFDERFGKD
jgi:dienelactone hydrolase